MTKFKEGDIVRVVDVNGAFRKPPPALISKIVAVEKKWTVRVEAPMVVYGPGKCGHIVYPYNIKLVTDKHTLFIYHMMGPFIDDPEFDTELYIAQYNATYRHGRGIR